MSRRRDRDRQQFTLIPIVDQGPSWIINKDNRREYCLRFVLVPTVIPVCIFFLPSSNTPPATVVVPRVPLLSVESTVG